MGIVGLVVLGQPFALSSSGGAWWSVAAQDRNQQRKQLLSLAAEHAKLAFLRSLGVRQKEILASRGSPIPWMR